MAELQHQPLGWTELNDWVHTLAVTNSGTNYIIQASLTEHLRKYRSIPEL